MAKLLDTDLLIDYLRGYYFLTSPFDFFKFQLSAFLPCRVTPSTPSFAPFRSPNGLSAGVS